MKAVFACLGAAVLVAGCASTTRDEPPPSMAAPADPMSPLYAPGYMMRAGSSDQFEIQSSQLALQMSRNPAVRAYAQRMIDHHNRTSAELMAIAQQNGLQPPPPQLLPPQQAALDRVRSAGPMQFDAVYKREQIAGHQEALMLHRGYRDGGDLPPFRDFAARTVPLIEGHLAEAQRLPDYAPPPPPPPMRAGERG
jgi:putative membrane protein